MGQVSSEGTVDQPRGGGFHIGRRALLAHTVGAFAGLRGAGLLATEESVAPRNLRLFLLAGQSNMAGRGGLEPEDRMVPERVWALSAAGAWAPAVDPLHFDKPAVVGVGPGRTFGIEMAVASPHADIGLIPCAVGGTRIDDWLPEVTHQPTRAMPWNDMLRRTQRAIQDGRLDAILWHQGESDSSPKLAAAYQAKLEDLVGRFRTTFGLPDLPVIVGQMGRFDERPWDAAKQEVDRAHRELPSRIRRTAYVSSEGLGHRGDFLHFNAEASRELGRRYARAYITLQGSSGTQGE
jgi:hypothetical protein